MVSSPSFNQAHLDSQIHLLHSLKAAVAVQTHTMLFEGVQRLALCLVVFEGLEIVNASATTWTLVNNDAIGGCNQQLLESVAFLLARIVVFAFLLIFWLAFGLLDAINDEGEFRISFFEFVNRTDALFAPLSFAFDKRKDAFSGAFRSWQDSLNNLFHQLNVATDEAFVLGLKQQGHKVLSEIEAIIKQEHQQTIG
jgi:hypothetical protein